MRRLLIVLPGLLALLAAAACTTVPAATGVPARTIQPASHPATPSSQQAHAAVAAGSVTLAFAGDVHFTGRTARLLSDPATAFGPIAAVLKSADFTAVNLETAVTSGGTPQPKTYHFRTGASAFTALRDGGVDLVTMANNHVLDYGQAGANAIDLARTLEAVRAARRLTPTVIVFMHWGTEGEACPDPNQLSLARQLAAAGASIIIGAHAHMLQGSGWLGHTFVAYGMGNFLWGELLQHGHRRPGTDPSPARTADRPVHPRGSLQHRQPIVNRPQHARRRLRQPPRMRRACTATILPPAPSTALPATAMSSGPKPPIG